MFKILKFKFIQTKSVNYFIKIIYYYAIAFIKFHSFKYIKCLATEMKETYRRRFYYIRSLLAKLSKLRVFIHKMF